MLFQGAKPRKRNNVAGLKKSQQYTEGLPVLGVGSGETLDRDRVLHHSWNQGILRENDRNSQYTDLGRDRRQEVRV